VSRDLLRRALGLVGAPPPGGVVLVTGAVGSGKTTSVTRLAQDLARHGVPVGGIVAPRVVRDGVTIGYDVMDLATGRAIPLASERPPGVPAGRFFLAEPGRRFAHEAILRGVTEAEVVCIDEIGPAELAGSGHAAAVGIALSSAKPLVLVVRDRLLSEAIDVFDLPHAVIVAIP